MNHPDDNANIIADRIDAMNAVEAFERGTVEHDIATGDQRLAESVDEPKYPDVELHVERIGPMQRIIAVAIDGVEFQVPGESDVIMNVGPGPTTLSLSLLVGSVETIDVTQHEAQTDE